MQIKESFSVALLFGAVFLFVPVENHVALVFPPARQYALDFLDNSRTKAPCGMPKGDIKTSFLSGSKLNVSWHLGYPHRGGFKIQLLDKLDRPVLDLTPTIQGAEFVSNDATAQSFQVQLPSDFTCYDCTLRLVRQALEWGSDYKFWSCADVDIKPRKEFRETCSNHGRNLVGRCKCDRLYYGIFCQFRDECLEDNDCGAHGKCVDIDATTAPKMQCYCQTGWFGPGCSKRSPVKSTDIDFELYSQRKLSDTFRLYWRILKERSEIEMVMVVNGTSYAAVGWRPKSLTKTCKNFPLIGSLPVNETKSESKAEPVPESSSEPEPTTTPKTISKKSTYSRRSAVSKAPLDADVVETSVSFQVSKKQSRNRREIEDDSEPEPEPTTEPTAEPTTEPEPEPEFTAKPEPEPEPTISSELKAEPEPEPETTSVPKAEPEPEPEPNSTPTKKSSKPQNAPSGVKEVANPYTPRFDFNPMDCTDIIIGSARGSVSRIGDYYTRDRSTPRSDSFWGGKDDLTAAMGFEKDGITTILFRKKLQATEPSDHSIGEELMHVIFAQGQEMGKYIHSPKSGVESGQASVKNFYKPDELKYHGHKSQRGSVSIDFLGKSQKDQELKTQQNGVEQQLNNNSTTDSRKFVSECSGEWKHPRRCSLENNTCEYAVKWEVVRKDEIRFDITTNHTDLWTGIAFSDNEKMSQSDAILGWVDKSGRPFLMDTWITGYSQPFLDSSQEIYKTTGRIVDGVTTLSFTRKRISADPKDLSFTDDHCLFMMFPIEGGIFNSVNKKIRKHGAIPVVSEERICIKSCGSEEDQITTTESPGISYTVTVKLVDLGENFVLPKLQSTQYDDLANSITDNFKPVFQKIAGFKKATVEDLQESANDLKATLNIQMSNSSKDKGRALNGVDSSDEQLQNFLHDSIKSGKVGNLKVDPAFLVFQSESLTSDSLPNASLDTDKSFFDLTETKFYIVIGCIVALTIIAVIQASCTIYKTANKNSSSHKDHLIPNSAWKDYSAANTNYAFDTLENEEKRHVNGKGRGESLPPKTNTRLQRPQGRPPNIPSHYTSDTRSLQRPRGNYTGNLERNTFSLPRTTHDRQRTDVQPDFYFMPSQRKYSGEIVRVYVDYNNQAK